MKCQREGSFLPHIQIPICWVSQVECQLMAAIKQGSLLLSVGLEWGCMAQGLSPTPEVLLSRRSCGARECTELVI